MNYEHCSQFMPWCAVDVVSKKVRKAICYVEPGLNGINLRIKLTPLRLVWVILLDLASG